MNPYTRTIFTLTISGETVDFIERRLRNMAPTYYLQGDGFVVTPGNPYGDIAFFRGFIDTNEPAPDRIKNDTLKRDDLARLLTTLEKGMKA